MLISLNWLRDFVDLPADLDIRALAERFTRTTAEVEEVIPIEVGARGLIAARVLNTVDLPGTHNLRRVELDVGDGTTVETVTAAPVLHVGTGVVYAPDGSLLKALGDVGTATVAGKTSAGMILPGEAIGIEMAIQEAVFLDHSVAPGTPLEPEMFEDWLIEVDNKSITHRPDLWGHYGVAREVAAILRRELKPYPVEPLRNLTSVAKPSVAITIADGHACRRYSGLILEGVPTQPAPLWMQLRLGHVGMRPISGLVDLTNYIMADLGQPMHAFDAAKVPCIEVEWAREGEVFRTLDGVDRTLRTSDLMIQCNGDSIALAGVMGGLETEVSEGTTSLLLESANFDPATIRRTAISLGLRTDASARFEKSLDPSNTALSIQRFIALARPMYPDLTLASRFSDCYPSPLEPNVIGVNPEHITRTIGRAVPAEEVDSILAPLAFELTVDVTGLNVRVPSFRSTNDVTIEEDVIEEIARYVGYQTIGPAMPRVTARRFEPNAGHELERRSLEYLTTAERFVEVHGYLWYNQGWLDQLRFDPGPCVELANPAAEGLHRLRQTLLPGLLLAVVKNRFYFPAFSLIEVGSVFEKTNNADHEFRHLALVKARRGKKTEKDLYTNLKGAIERWCWQHWARPVRFLATGADSRRPFEHPLRTAAVDIDGTVAGRISVVDLPLRRRMDEHLASWSIAWGELRLTGLETLEPLTEPMGTVPPYPLIEMDFSILVPTTTPYQQVAGQLASFSHELIKTVSYVGCYDGDSIKENRRSLTFRVVIGDDNRTLVEADANSFRDEFTKHLSGLGYELRA
jgi:phenylalanyl-tRNA synthetase beta chain